MGKALAVSDGSFQNQCGACAWIVKGANERNQIKGSMLTPGNTGDHSSFRSKAANLYGLLMTMWYLLKDNLLTGILTAACGGRTVEDQC